MTALKVGLTIHVTSYTGWGMVALGLASELASRPDVALSIFSADFQGVNALERSRLQPLHQPAPSHFDGVLIHADGNACSGPSDQFTASKHVGLMVFEDTSVLSDQQKLDRLRRYDLVVTASRWNHELLTAAGLPNVLVHQGIDPTVWHPAPKSGRWRDRFVVFSGGKLEYRKGQDIVLAAFREFQKQHPEALLLTCWQNPWTDLACNMTLNEHIEHEPERLGNLLDIDGWFDDNGLPEGSAIDLGLMPNALLAPIVREADVAVFMSRAEGATNLGAMEAMAAGIETILSGGTGHDDIPGNHLRHRVHFPNAQPRHFRGVDGWIEEDPAEVVEALEARYVDCGAGTFPTVHRVPTWADYADNLLREIRGEQRETWNLDTAIQNASA